MNQQQMVNAFISGIQALVDPASNIQLLLGSILTAEIHSKPDNKESVCREINKLLLLIKQTAKIQMILAVINDDNDRYVNLIGAGIESSSINTSEWTG